MQVVRVYSGKRRVFRLFQGDTIRWGEPTGNVMITARCADGDAGRVYGSGIYGSGQNATLSAFPFPGYAFLKWEDGNTQAVRVVTATEDRIYTALFGEGPTGIISYLTNY